jgi:hypothetical protein
MISEGADGKGRRLRGNAGVCLAGQWVSRRRTLSVPGSGNSRKLNLTRAQAPSWRVDPLARGTCCRRFGHAGRAMQRDPAEIRWRDDVVILDRDPLAGEGSQAVSKAGRGGRRLAVGHPDVESRPARPVTCREPEPDKRAPRLVCCERAARVRESRRRALPRKCGTGRHVGPTRLRGNAGVVSRRTTDTLHAALREVVDRAPRERFTRRDFPDLTPRLLEHERARRLIS